MKATIIKIGNSRGIRIPKMLLEESNIGTDVDVNLRNGNIIISPKKETLPYNEEYLLSNSALAKGWDTPEEDAAWAYLQ